MASDDNLPPSPLPLRRRMRLVTTPGITVADDDEPAEPPAKKVVATRQTHSPGVASVYHDKLLAAPCAIGMTINSECHAETFTVSKDVFPLSELSDDDLYALQARLGLKIDTLKDICNHHMCTYLRYYSRNHMCCCDPLDRHSKKVKSQLREITVKLAQETTVVQLIPGKKLCATCQTRLSAMNCETYSDPDSDTSYNSPPAKKAARNVTEELDWIVGKLREKLAATESSEERLSLLTLAPEQWSRREVCQRLDVSEYWARQARKLRDEKGVLGKRDPKIGRKISEETRASIQSAYEDDEFSRMCPGSKDFVVVRNTQGQKERHQKRLMLVGLKELFLVWKEQRGERETCGFSTFASLRPKYCVLAGSAGMVLRCAEFALA